MFKIHSHFKYKIIQNGNITHGTINTQDYKTAKENIPYGDIIYLKKTFVFYKKIDLQEIRSMFFIINRYLSCGLTLSDCLYELIDSNSGRLKEITSKIYADIHAGSIFSDAISKHNNIFDPTVINLIKVGEKIGKLNIACEAVTEYLSRIIEIKDKLRQASRYPIFALIAMIFSAIFMNKFLIQPMVTFMISVNTTLPNMTRYMIEYVFNYTFWTKFFLTLSFISFLVKVGIKIFPDIKLIISQNVFKIFLIGNFIKAINLFYFANNMNILLSHNIFLTDAVKISKNAMTNTFLRHYFENIENQIKNGFSLSSCLANSNIFPNFIKKIISASEKNSSLNIAFKEISDFYYKQFIDFQDTFIKLIEPIALLFIATILILLIFSTIIPMYEIINQIDAS